MIFSCSAPVYEFFSFMLSACISCSERWSSSYWLNRLPLSSFKF